MRLILAFLVATLTFAQPPPPPTATERVEELQIRVNELQVILDYLRALVFVPPPASSLTVRTAAELQAALDMDPAPLIQVDPAGSYVANFILKAKATPTIVRGGDGPAFTWKPGIVTPTDPTPKPIAVPTTTFPKLVAKDPLVATLAAQHGARDYSFSGLEVTGVARDRNVLEFGVGVTELAQFPTNISFERMYIHGTQSPYGHRGIYFDVTGGIVRDSYFGDFVELGRDSNTILGNGPGPYLIERNYLEASGEGIMFGGVDPKVPGLRPTGIIIRDNYLPKFPAWLKVYRSTAGVESNTWSAGATLVSGYPGSIKNCIELKNADEVLIEGNTCDYVPVDAQVGHGAVFTVRNQNGGCPWCNVTNVVMRCNTIRDTAGFAVNILGTDVNFPSGSAHTISIDRNLFVNTAGGIQVGHSVKDLSITNNVMVGIRSRFLAFYGPTRSSTGFIFTGNRASVGLYGLHGDVVGTGLPALLYAPGYTFIGNTLESPPVMSYPPGNTLVAPGTIKAADWKCAA